MGKDAIVKNNRAIDILRYNAFLLDGWDGAVFSGNILHNVDRSMKIEGGRNITVTGNTFNLTNTDYCDINFGGLCRTQAGSAIQLTSTITSCGYFQLDGTTPECGLRNVNITGNNFTRSGGIGLQTGAGGLQNITIASNNFDRMSRTSAKWGVVITQDNLAHVASDINIIGNTMVNMPYRAIDIAAGNYVTIRGNRLRGAAGASQGIAINPSNGLTEIKDLVIADNELEGWSTVGGGIVILDDNSSVLTYRNLQVRGNTVNQGTANNALRADLRVNGAASSNYLAVGSVVSDNTFIGNVRLPQADVTLGTNLITGTNNDFTGLSASSVRFCDTSGAHCYTLQRSATNARAEVTGTQTVSNGAALNYVGLASNGPMLPATSTFANLGTWGFLANGMILYCSDCVKGSAPCAGGGTGSRAIRENGQWNCD